MGIADLHIHTTCSWDGTCTIQAALKQASHVMGLDVIAITDHDVIEGAFRARDIAWKYDIDVIVGMEVSTLEGHLLCLYLCQAVPAGLPLEETVLRVHDQGGLCIAAHPEAHGVPSLKAAVLERALQNQLVTDTLVGMETFNAGLVFQRDNIHAFDLANRFYLSATGNSDAHLAWMIGTGATFFPGKTSTDLHQALLNRRTEAVSSGRISHLYTISSWLTRFSLRKMGWVTNNLSPHHPLVTSRMVEAYSI